MKTKLFKKGYSIIICAAFLVTTSEAQIIYTNVNPDASGYCSPFSSCWHEYLFDLNNDGNNDFGIHEGSLLLSCVINGNTQSFDYFTITAFPLDSNIIASQDSSSPYKFSLADTIGPQLLWDKYFSLTMVNSIPGVTACGVPVPGTWNSTGYAGLQLKVGNQIYYGWVRVLAYGNFSTDASYTVFDYAYNSTPNQFILAGDTGTGPAGVIHVSTPHNSVTISPNPFSISTTLIINSQFKMQDAQLKIYNMTGREVSKYKIINHKTEIERGNLLSGIYFYKVQSENEIIGTGKLNIQ